MKKIILLVVIILVILAIVVVTKGQQKAVEPVDETPAAEETETAVTTEEGATSTTSSLEGMQIFSMSAIEGEAPLLVEITPQYMDMLDNWIDLGDGTTAEVVCLGYVPDTDRCTGLKMISHTYTTAGTYTVKFFSGLKNKPTEAEVLDAQVITVR